MKIQKRSILIYGFIDESGYPGATENNNDYLSATVVLFSNLKETEKAEQRINDLKRKVHLDDDYEFHSSRNTLSIQRKFLETIAGLSFSYVFISIKKTPLSGFASYKNLANLLLAELDRVLLAQEVVIRMDDNPAFYKELRTQTKNFQTRPKIKQVHSKNLPLVQLADYIVSMSTKQLKGRKMNAVWHKIEKKKIK